MPWKQNYTISDEIGIRDSEVRWPGGKRCCVSITVDLSVATGPAGVTAHDLVQPTSLFGMGEGLDQILGALRRFGLTATFVAPAVMAAAYPDRIEAVLRDGHEVAAGGFDHRDVSRLSMEEERETIGLATDILSRIAGRRPDGWFSLPRQQDEFAVGTVSPNTIDLLIDAGFLYMGNGLADDAPHYWVTAFDTARALLTLPYYYHFDDQFFLMFPTEGTGLDRVDALVRNWKAEFAAQYRRGRYFGMTIHPRGMGWAHRAQALEGVFAYLAGFPDLWNASGSLCARHWLEHFPARTHLNLSPSIWKDHEGSLS